jgi:hypothetical protein
LLHLQLLALLAHLHLLLALLALLAHLHLLLALLQVLPVLLQFLFVMLLEFFVCLSYQVYQDLL